MKIYILSLTQKCTQVIQILENISMWLIMIDLKRVWTILQLKFFQDDCYRFIKFIRNKNTELLGLVDRSRWNHLELKIKQIKKIGSHLIHDHVLL